MQPTLYPIQKALVSVYDKTHLEKLAEYFKTAGTQVYSTGGTAEALRKAGVEVINVDSVTSFPEMMDGRVKTLHPKIFGGILARRYEQKDLEQANQYSIPLFDLIVVNLYPFWDHLGKTYKEQSAFVDIGGPSMLRAAAKNCDAVTVLSSPDDYADFLNEIELNQGTTFAFRHRLAARTFARTAQYDALISTEWLKASGESSLPGALALGPSLPLRYGENPHQKAVWAFPTGKKWDCLQGKELSYNNLLDAEAATRLAFEFADPSCVIVKHNNPCGVASGKFSSNELFKKALLCDEKSAFGGIVAFNREVDAMAAEALSPIFLEVVIATSFTEEAKTLLSKKKNLRLIQWAHPQFQSAEIRMALGGWLVQECDTEKNSLEMKLVTTATAPSSDIKADLQFAWSVAKHVRSNAIVLAKEGRTLGIGAGQMSRVDAVQIALSKAKGSLQGAVLASDAFFPFRDNIDLLKGSGISAIIQPGGSQRDAEVIQACNEQQIALFFTGVRHFRH